MYFRQILHPDLGCASYVIADQGDAAVIDPKWQIEEYLTAAREAGAEIRYVLETHTHADHVSGRRRLAAATGAAVVVPANPADPRASGIRAGRTIGLGSLELLALAAPGHRPEHLAYLARRDGRPWLLLSGDSLLVGDVARPDLAVQADEGAAAMWETLRRFDELEDAVELWPAHVGGSLCAGRSASERTSSTLGAERGANPMLGYGAVAAFSAELRRCIPARPPRTEHVVELNRRGVEDPGPIRELDAACLACIGVDRLCMIDVRDAESFDAGHLAGSINLPMRGQGIGVRAAWAAGPEELIVLVAPSRGVGSDAAELLRAAGVWNLAGLSVADPEAWRDAGLERHTSSVLAPESVARRVRAGELRLVDVRDPSEWRAGHVAGSRSLPLSELGDGREVGLEPGAPVAVACATGVRAALAASVLRRRGHRSAARLPGSVEQLAALGLPLVEDAA
jgi:glyoxylase-like metal-dependent hydrolase (beta-lactamase superfamily II)/rhodanese-related sulfurtransferase